MTFKKVSNHYYAQDSGTINVTDSPQSVTGSDAEDSLNGNDIKPSLEVPLTLNRDGPESKNVKDYHQTFTLKSETPVSYYTFRSLGGGPHNICKDFNRE